MTEGPARDLWQGIGPALAEVAAEGRTGRLQAHSAGDEVGVVVFAEGRLAWATCRYQPEHLGSFLARLGHVTPEQLKAARAAYDEHEGRRKFGRILEDHGLIEQPVLRRCLVLHLRMALACLIRNDSLVVGWSDGELASSDDMSFELAEVMPDPAAVLDERHLREKPRWEALEPFSDVPGFRAAMVAEPSGEVLAISSNSVETSVQMEVLGAALASVFEGASEASPREVLGDVGGLVVEGSEGTVVARWLENGRGAVLAVVLSIDGKVGMARHRLATAFPDVQERLHLHRLEQE